jgi:ABC-type bacteriocin/lantibiotic exporter with double-glycine peptidase domain
MNIIQNIRDIWNDKLWRQIFGSIITSIIVIGLMFYAGLHVLAVILAIVELFSLVFIYKTLSKRAKGW